MVFMTPAEQVPLIKDCIDELLACFDDDTMLVLSQFRIDLGGYSYGRSAEDRRWFLEKVLSDIKDRLLIDLHSYLLGDTPPVTIAPGTEARWEDLPVRAFLSHKHEDAVWVGALKNALRSFGVTCFVAHEDIEPSKQWQGVLQTALRTCNVLVALVGPGFHDSQWCDQEVGWALGREVPIITVRLDPDSERNKDGFLGQFQELTRWSSAVGSEYRVASDVFETVVKILPSQEQARELLVTALQRSPSFDRSRMLWPLIEKQTEWNQPNLDGLQHALESNDQVHQTYIGYSKVPMAALLSDLIAEHDSTPEPDWLDDEPY